MKDEFSASADDTVPVPGVEGVSRRRFLGLLGASAALAGAAACSRPRGGTVVPYTHKSGEGVPGVAESYASAFQEGVGAVSVLVKSREGRPIHVDGNDEHPAYGGASGARTQAQVLGLYDPDRLTEPIVDGKKTRLEAAEDRIREIVASCAANDRKILLVTESLCSPSRRALLGDLADRLPGLVHAAWEAIPEETGRRAAEALFGGFRRPAYRFDRARFILALEADFLGTMGDSIRAARAFAAGRTVRSKADTMSRLVVAEGGMSLTGTNADLRLKVRPTAQAALAAALAASLNRDHGLPLPAGFPPDLLKAQSALELAKRHGLDASRVAALAGALAEAGGDALVLAGPQLPAGVHAACHLLNAMLGGVGHTVDYPTAPGPAPLTPGEARALFSQMQEGDYDAVVFWNVNPAYDSPDPDTFHRALAKVPRSVYLGLYADETAKACSVALPVNHWLESWGDYREEESTLLLQQPLIESLYGTKQAEEVVLGWIGALGGTVPTSYREYVKQRVEREDYPAGSPVSFAAFWHAVLHDGLSRSDRPSPTAPSTRWEALGELLGAALQEKEAEAELLLHPDARLFDGRYANNGWLQELPEPVTKTVWGNALALSPGDASALGVEEGDEVSLRAGDRGITLPALVQPGQADGVVSVALGFGRREGAVGGGIGSNAFPLVGRDGLPLLRRGVSLAKTGKKVPLARTQNHHAMHGRELVKAMPLALYREAGGEGESRHEATLYKARSFGPHKWGMVIDVNACVGCAGCVAACQSENNIPVVGPEEAARGREMHWIRIDRYHEGEEESPRTLHQPMLCQQCDDAPCENVCPVNATTHSPEGLNQQAYNRCVGTRYCANNCPYKVRRFNYLDFTGSLSPSQTLAFNPEVSVRPRGVMEKCTFCVQRIQNGKQVAKGEGRALRDGEIRPACAQACPTEAIVFGDLLDESSEVAELSKSDRGFKVLEGLGVKPSITYLAKLWNDPEEGGPHGA